MQMFATCEKTGVNAEKRSTFLLPLYSKVVMTVSPESTYRLQEPLNILNHIDTIKAPHVRSAVASSRY